MTYAQQFHEHVQHYNQLLNLIQAKLTLLNTLDQEMGPRGEPLFSTIMVRELEILVEKQLDLMDGGTSLSELLSLDAAPYPDLSLAAHNYRTALISLYLATTLTTDSKELMAVGLGAILHDLGKLCIDPAVLNKPGTFSPEEYQHVKTHSRAGYDLLHHETWLPAVALNMVLHHHERLDGSGYPCGLTAESLGTWDRLVAVADVFDAMTSKRIYRDPFCHDEALNAMGTECRNSLDQGWVQRLRLLLGLELGADENPLSLITA